MSTEKALHWGGRQRQTSYLGHGVTYVNSVQRYAYDSNGNMAVRGLGLSTQQNLTWDQENHLSSISGGGLPTESYLYDADGQRVKKISGGVATYYPNPYYEVSGSTITKYYYFHGQRVAMRTNASGGWAHYDLHSDHLGSTVFVTAQTGATHSTEGYYAYGRTRTGGIPVTDQKFTGQKRDGTGLQYFNARYYDPELGQFLSPDTLVPDPGNLYDYNRYMYVRGNPMNAIDPSGHICVPVVNIGNTCQGGTDWDAVQSSLDATGIVDPTPISDGVNAVISVARGNYVDAGLSAVAIVPVLGDLAKGGKYLDEAAAGARWVGDKADEGWQAAKRWTDCLINSFSAKTLVMTPAGLKAISALVEGELVLAYNEATGEIGAYPITDVISHVDPEIVLLTIDDETLETTAEHPFYELESAPWLAAGETEGRWTDALELKAGDHVWKADGSSGVVQSVAVVPVQQRMYNLTVAEAHTFFVGQQSWLVHNCGGLIAGTRGLDHSFDRHAHEWWGMMKPNGDDAARFANNYRSQWQALVEQGANSKHVVDWSTGGDATTLHLSFIDGKYFAVQFYKTGDRAGELATAFMPNSDQVRAIKELLAQK